MYMSKFLFHRPAFGVIAPQAGVPSRGGPSPRGPATPATGGRTRSGSARVSRPVLTGKTSIYIYIYMYMYIYLY